MQLNVTIEEGASALLTCAAVRCPSVVCALVPHGTFPVRAVFVKYATETICVAVGNFTCVRNPDTVQG